MDRAVMAVSLETWVPMWITAWWNWFILTGNMTYGMC